MSRLPNPWQVFQATDTKLNRQVALRILPDPFASHPDRLATFQRGPRLQRAKGSRKPLVKGSGHVGDERKSPPVPRRVPHALLNGLTLDLEPAITIGGERPLVGQAQLNHSAKGDLNVKEEDHACSNGS